MLAYANWIHSTSEILIMMMQKLFLSLGSNSYSFIQKASWKSIHMIFWVILHHAHHTINIISCPLSEVKYTFYMRVSAGPLTAVTKKHTPAWKIHVYTVTLPTRDVSTNCVQRPTTIN